MNTHDATFQKRYLELNEKQKEAVDALQGPVMVIAGPGTGKTEILAMRIANLLRSELQVNPYEILCLTYTEEGSVAMRKRLLQIIGKEAHRVHIYTFHAFCNNIIQSNPEYFGIREIQPVSDLERTEILHQLLDELPDGHPFRRLKGNIYYDAINLFRLFELMKQENWTPEYLSDAIQLYLEDLPNRESYIYKRANAKMGIKVGDVKQKDIEKEKEKMQKTLLASALLPKYQEIMLQKGRYDFSDMILWVLKAFDQHDEFLQQYQERFQYVMVDEFQDTSGAQSKLLNKLMDYWESPNLFIVGDDDQSIFEFQGARLRNIVDLYKKYKGSLNNTSDKNGVKVIVLKQNYRSSQSILNISTRLINHNQQRLINELSELGLDKNIVSSHKRFKEENEVFPNVTAYYNALHEEAGIINQIEELQQKGVPLNTIAILYAQHKQADNIIALLTRKEIPYWVKRPVDILGLPLITQLLNIFRYLDTEIRKPFSGEEYLFKMLHMPFWNISAVDVARLSLSLQEGGYNSKPFRIAIADHLFLASLNLDTVVNIHRLGQCIYEWLSELQKLTISMLLEKIIYDAGILAQILNSKSRVWDMQVLHTFFNFVKEENTRQPRMTLSDFLHIIDKMILEHLPIPVQKINKDENGVRLYTAFGAKGHEFEHVFLIGCTKNYWEKKKGTNRGFPLPDNLTKTENASEEGSTEEVMRRVFYVALTRAKKHLHISYSLQDNSGKDLEPSQFISESDEGARLLAEENTKIMDEQSLLQHISWAMTPEPPVNILLAQRELISRKLETFALSVSTLNAYLRCPVSFYFDHILQAPSAKNDSMAFGTAVHYALEKLFKDMKSHPEKKFADIETLISNFNKSLWRNQDAFTEIQFERRKELGANILRDYYEQYYNVLEKNVVTEFMIKNIEVGGVPVKGKIDKIEFTSSGCRVVDYKTGNPEYSKKNALFPPSEDNPAGGDYWRQMVFYKILLDTSPIAKSMGWKMKEGVFDYIEKKKDGSYLQYLIPITQDDIYVVKNQIKETYDKIMHQKFEQGCNQEDCVWCNFVKTFELMKKPEPYEEF